ncbi:MAG: SUMF1/EgtB/PvdO family nonheme iron enzyme, partial [Anaerolineae bacterium]|nr:SUMF1/EgtB/PvdO family nonheme iron enzyme [Anaerolineae bacterium]
MSGIFISYRRSTSQHFARSIFNELQQRGHDVFLDVNSIDNGAFDHIIRNQIAARPHFLLILSKGALERCVNEEDWLLKEIQEALRLNRNIVPVYDDGFNFADEKHFLPEPLQIFLSLQNAPPYSHYYFKAFIDALSDRFFKDRVDDVVVTPTPSTERTEVQKRIEQAAQPNDGWKPQIEVTDTPQPVSPQIQAELNNFTHRVAQAKYELIQPTPSHPQIWGVENILSQPFEWVYIPPGKILYTEIDAFNIAKYPITNAQFEIFIQAEDGYQNPDWWKFNPMVRAWYENNSLPQPRAFPENDHPRANVNYYEATAFCKWLEHRFNAPSPNLPPMKITLPNSWQWMWAASGNRQLDFPWGNGFDTRRCNSLETKIGRTTPVTEFPTGASPYGVMDIIGNVSEWCI